MKFQLFLILFIVIVQSKYQYKHNCECTEQDKTMNFCQKWTCVQQLQSQCFHPDSQIQVYQEQNDSYLSKSLKELQIYDIIQNYDVNQKQFFQDKIIGFLDSSNNASEFINLYLNPLESDNDQMGKQFLVTQNHLIYVQNKENYLMAINIEDGDILVVYGKKMEVVGKEMVMKKGFIAPLTQSGTLLVDGVLSSCYANVEYHHLAHLSFLPFRVIQNLKFLFSSQTQSNVHQDLLNYVSFLKHLDTHYFNGYFVKK